MTDALTIFRDTNAAKVREKAIEALSELLKRSQRKPILLLLSGGSWMELYDRLSVENLSRRVTIGMGDERYSEDPNISNFAQLKATNFYRQAQAKDVQWISPGIRVKETLGEFAQRFENELRNWKRANPQGKVIITQGIGEDGHTAGIFPYPEDRELFSRLFDNRKQWAIGYDAKTKSKYPLRVTITLPFFREVVDHSVVYMSGGNKRDALRRVLAPEGNLWETPARIIHTMKDVRLFTDLYL